jgi:hypothetical protein
MDNQGLPDGLPTVSDSFDSETVTIAIEKAG